MEQKTLLLFCCLLLLPSTVLARLGETERENQVRYGEPLKDDHSSPLLNNTVNKTYHYQGWKIRVGYINGHAVRIAYSKLPKANESQFLKDDEIAAVMEAETHGGRWTKLKSGSLLFPRGKSGNTLYDTAPLRWSNTNKSIAYCATGRFVLFIEAPDAAIWEQALENEKEVKRRASIPKF